MTDQPRFLFVMPKGSGWGSARGSRRFFHGGERYGTWPKPPFPRTGWSRSSSGLRTIRSSTGGGVGCEARRCRGPRRLAVAELRGGGALRRGAPGASLTSQGDPRYVRLPARVDRSRRGRPTRCDRRRFVQDDDLDGGRVRGGDHACPAARHPGRDRCRPDGRMAGFRTDGAPGFFRDLADCRVGLAGYGSINRHYRRFVEPFGGAVNVSTRLCRTMSQLPTPSSGPTRCSTSRGRATSWSWPSPDADHAGVIDEPLSMRSRRGHSSSSSAAWRSWSRRRSGAGPARTSCGSRSTSTTRSPRPRTPGSGARRTSSRRRTSRSVPFAHERCLTEACADAVRVLTGKEPHHAATVRDKWLYDGTLVTTRRTIRARSDLRRAEDRDREPDALAPRSRPGTPRAGASPARAAPAAPARG